MSLIKTIKAQLGLSNTATQNFTLTAEAADGTMKLARGNAGATTQDIITVASDGKVVLNQNIRTWQTVTRVSGTLYTSPAWDICLNVSATTSTNNVLGSISIVIGSSPSFTFAQGGGGAVAQCALAGSVIIPANSSYTLTTTNVSTVSFTELR